MEYFEVVLDDPQEIFYPGDNVSGRVVFKSCELERTTGVLLKLEGKAIVLWTETAHRGDVGIRNPVGNNNFMFKESFSNTDVFYKSHVYLFGDGQTKRAILPEETSYRFCMQLPNSHLCPSFSADFGRVEYKLQAVMIRSQWKSDYETKKQKIMVNAIVDLNLIPLAPLPGQWQKTEKVGCLCCASGPLSLNVMLMKQGYCPGDIILVETEANNGSNKEVSDLSVQLWQEFTYFAGGESKETSKEIARVRRGKPVAAYESESWRAEIKIPPVPPTVLGCRVLTVEYTLKVEAHVSGITLNLRVTCPIVIGTIPLHSG